MAEDVLGRLTVHGEHEMDIAADKADVYMTVRGSAILSGSVGLRTVREVAEIISELERIGVAESEIHLYSVTSDVNNRAIGKSSSAICRLRVTCRQLNLIPAIVLSIGSARQASVDRIEWGYSHLSVSEAECLQQAFRKAAEKATRSADALSATLGGIRRAVEVIEHGGSHVYMAAPMARAERASVVEDAIPDLPMGETRKLTTRVKVVYRLAPAELGK